MRDAFNKTGQGVTYFLAAGNVAMLPKVLMGDTLRMRPNYQAAWPSVEGPSLLKYHPMFWAPDIANSKDKDLEWISVNFRKLRTRISLTTRWR